jgi:hypothetical protein
VSNIDSRINPAPPQRAKNIDIIANVLSVQLLFGDSRPMCRSQRSAINARSKDTTVTALPAMKSGFKLEAPTSDMNLDNELVEG